MFKSIKQKGLEKHLDEIYVDYKKVVKMFKYGATNKAISDETGKDVHAVANWRTQYNDESKQAEHNADIAELKDV